VPGLGDLENACRTAEALKRVKPADSTADGVREARPKGADRGPLETALASAGVSVNGWWIKGCFSSGARSRRLRIFHRKSRRATRG
jgi:hypothetical protein